ncbi:Uncharacterised protein [Mycobacterium tuberculosis]|nr:Uncharacterised protein [Mycobacterium tuberculosis]
MLLSLLMLHLLLSLLPLSWFLVVTLPRQVSVLPKRLLSLLPLLVYS